MTATKKCKDKIVDESFRAQPSRWGRGGRHLFVIYSTLIAPFHFNPLTPASDWHLISPYHITPESNIKVKRIK